MSKSLEQLQSENHRHFETRTANIMLALKREITHLQKEQKNRMLELKFEREQFKKKHRCHADRGQSVRRKKSHKRAPSFQAQIDRWMTSVRKFCVDTGPKIYFPEETEDKQESEEIIQSNEEYCDKADQSKKDGESPSSGLPSIEESPCSVSSRVHRGPFITKIKENDNFKLDIPEDIGEGIDLPRIPSLRKISCISLPNRRLSMPFVNRLRSTSMPGMSMTSRMQIEASLARNSNVSSNDYDTSRDTARRPSDIPTPISGKRNSVGVSTSRVISDLNRGIMYRDLDEEEEEGEISDEVWKDLSHCRYLRNHRYSL